MRFETPWAFVLLLAVVAILALRWQRRRGATLTFSSTENAGHSGRSMRQRLLWVPLALRLAALTLFTVALARPQMGRERIRDVSKGIATEMVVDRSGSMKQEMDFEGAKLSRLDIVKKVFERFVSGDGHGLKGRPHDLIGMVAFARYPDTICPLTLAHGALKPFLDTVKNAETRQEDGTAIGDAVALAAARLHTAERTLARQTGEREDKYQIKSKVMILLTDGENNAGKRDPLQAAKLAATWGIKIHTIGVGGRDSVMTIDTPFGPRSVRNPMDNGVNKELLHQMADVSGGIFRMAEDGKSLYSIYQEIDKLERSEIESVPFVDYREVFTPFALAGLALLMIEVLLAGTVFRRTP
jgi:Ca-activated chloride channel homolog